MKQLIIVWPRSVISFPLIEIECHELRARKRFEQKLIHKTENGIQQTDIPKSTNNDQRSNFILEKRNPVAFMENILDSSTVSFLPNDLKKTKLS